MSAGDKDKVNKLQDYFEKRDDVVMAFLFGSHAVRRAHAGSDWDIAVYFKPLTDRIEIEKDRDYPQEKQVRGDCIDILRTDNVDVIVLNRAPAVLADAAIRGHPLVIKDRALRLEFMLRITSQAIDFRALAEDYARIYWRSASLSKSEVYSLNRRLIFIGEEIVVLADYAGLTWETYQSDRSKRSVVERSIEKTMNAVIDVSKIVLASERKPIPETYVEIILHAGLLEPFSTEITKRLSGWVDLRNILAHEYLDYRWKEIKDFLENHGPVLRSFLDAARKFLEKKRAP